MQFITCTKRRKNNRLKPVVLVLRLTSAKPKVCSHRNSNSYLQHLQKLSEPILLYALHHFKEVPYALSAVHLPLFSKCQELLVTETIHNCIDRHLTQKS